MARRIPILLLLLAVAWFASGALRPLLEPDEGRYAEIPREMWVSGDWVTPHLNGVAYLEKPPLQYWATAVAYSLFGIGEMPARLWALTVSFLALPIVYLAASRLYRGREAGLAAVVALAVSPYFVLVGQINSLDGAFATLLAGAVLALVVGLREPERAGARRWLVAAWLLLALAVLQKGIAAPVLAGGTLVLYTLASRDWSAWRRMHWLPGVAVFLLVVVPWFWLVAGRNPDFLYFFFVHEHFARFLTTVHDRVEPWWYFILIAVIAILPWWRALTGAARLAWEARGEGGATGFRAAVFLGLWLVVVFLFFSASGSKLPPYILPCMPVAAVLLAPQLVRDPRAVAAASATTLAFVAAAAIGLCVGSARRSGDGSMPTEVVAWAVLALLIAGAAWAIQRRNLAMRPGPSGWTPLALGAVLAWQALLVSYGAMPPLRTARDLVAQVRQHVGPRTTVYSVRQYRQSVPVYLGRTLRLADFRGELAYGLDRAPGAALATLADFAVEWQGQTDAVAFMTPAAHAQLQARGLPGRVIGRDGRSIVVVRQ